MKDLISVIVPIYNAEKYLKNCLDAIKNQTYNNIEIILINDGSNDGSANIIKKYCKKDKRFKVIHKENAGVSKARNNGLDIATGEYIIFIDSDDFISNNYIEILYNNIKKYNADISMCNIIRVDEKGNYIEKIDIKRKNDKPQTILMNKNEYISNILDSKYYYTYATNKLVKKSIINNIRFRDDIYYNEDGVFFLDISKNINKAVLIYPIYAYFYVQNNTSANGQIFNERYLTVIKSFEIMEKYFNQFNEKNKCYFSYRYICYSIETCYYTYKNGGKFNNKIIRNVKSKYWKYAISADNLTLLQKLKFVLKLLFPKTIMNLKYRKG